MTLSKLAKLAGVSVSTVSKVFSDSSEISDKTKETVLELAKKNGCYEKYYKPKYEKKVIAVICPELLGVHYSQMVTYIEEAVSKNGDTLLVSVANFSPKNQSALLDYYMNFLHVDAIIVIEPTEKIKNHTDIPIVQIGMNNESATVHCVDVEIKTALDSAISYLKKHGHEKIGYIGENYTAAEYSRIKEAAIRNKIELCEKYVEINDKRFQDCGYYGAEKMIEENRLPTAIFAAYSHIAIGIMKKLGEENIKIPEDVSLICMDDLSCVPYSSEELSCIRMHLQVLCSEAVGLLYRCFENRYDKTKQVITVSRSFDKGKTVGDVKGM